jgi:hypothetical protein
MTAGFGSCASGAIGIARAPAMPIKVALAKSATTIKFFMSILQFHDWAK